MLIIEAYILTINSNKNYENLFYEPPLINIRKTRTPQLLQE